MGILNWFKDRAYRASRKCTGCGKTLIGLQTGACSYECEAEAEWMQAIR